MKRLALILPAIVAVTWFGWRLAGPTVSGEKLAATAGGGAASPPPSRINRDSTAVFERAFWKRPSSEDQIRHAERREWIDAADGISRWQWFIEVRPSPGLVKHLIADNAFNLAPADTLPAMHEPPFWFAADAKAFRVLRSPSGGMTLLFDEQANLLLATDSGGGFHKGAVEPGKPVAASPITHSRLPNSPPPKP